MAHELFDPRIKYSAPSNAQLVYNGGPRMNSVKLVGVFVDSFPYQKEMSAFLDWFASSDVLANMKEYNVSGSGSHVGDFNVSLLGNTPPPPPPPPKPHPCRHRHGAGSGILSVMDVVISNSFNRSASAGSSVVSDSDLQVWLSKLIGGVLPKNDGNTLYVIFLPDGVTVDLGQDASCQSFCGYHNNFQANDGSQVFYAILPFPSCAGCLGGLKPVDALTSITTHEIAEAVTDPIPGQGWYDDANGEIGDICAWQQRKDASYTVQKLWSNKKNSCQ